IAASFLETSPDVRSAGLGGDQVALPNHIGSLFSNPAGLSSLQIPELYLSHQQSFLNTQYEAVGFALPLKTQTLGFAARYINEGALDRIDETGSSAGQFRPYTMMLQGSWAKNFNRFSMGSSLKAWNEKLDKQSTSGWAADLGSNFAASRS